MKTILIILLFVSVNRIYSQDLSVLENKFNWSKFELRSFDSTDLNTIFHVIENLPFRTKSDALNHLDLFHLVDYNNDFKIDVLYSGWTGSEGTMLLVIQNTGSGFEIVQTIYGSVQDLKVANGKITDIQILDYSCCAGYVDHLQLWKLSGDKTYAHFNDLALIVDTNIPSIQFDFPIRFKITNERYNMRIEPEIKQLGENDVPFNPIEGQNISASFTSGNTGTAIAQKEDETGRIWWFVIMDQMPSNKYPKLFYEGNNDIYTYKAVGWISSRYIEKIEE